MMTKILLSICIPTYNRQRNLGYTLAQLHKSILILNKEDFSSVEILIGDNSSTDNTAGLVELFSKSLPQIKYFRRTDNVGAEENWFRLIRSSSGAYCWVLSDDDWLHEKSLSLILEALKDCPDFVFVNYKDTISTMVKLRPSAFDFSLFPAKSDENIHYLNRGTGAVDFFEHTKFRSSFLSSNIIRRPLFMLSEAGVPTRADFPYIQIVIANKILGQYGKWTAIEIPLLIMRGLAHLQTRARALDQGHKHFYFDAFLQLLTFIDTTLVSDNLKKNIASAFIYQIAVEKHCLWALSRSDNSRQYYWFAKLKEAYSILLIRKSLAFYIEGIPLMLAPAFLGNIYYFLRFILVADLLSAAKRRSNHGEIFLWLIFKLYKSCVNLIAQLAPPRGV